MTDKRYTAEELRAMADSEQVMNLRIFRMLQQAAEDCERMIRAEEFILYVGNDLLNRRVADWYPEGANNAALTMSEDMRLIGNACMEFDAARTQEKAND